MGNDGGTIAKRSDVIRLYKQDVVAQEKMQDGDEQFVCFLTKADIEDGPLMGDYKGRVYMKENVLGFLVKKEYKSNESMSYVKSLGDLVDLNPTFKSNKLECPVSQASNNLVYLRECGCILSRKMVDKLVELGTTKCPNCTKPFEQVDIVIINANGKDVQLNEHNYQTLVKTGLTHSKRQKKKKRTNDTQTPSKHHTPNKHNNKKRKL